LEHTNWYPGFEAAISVRGCPTVAIASMSDIEKTIKVVSFSEAKDWSKWKHVFLARACQKDPELGKCFDLDVEFKTAGNDDEAKKNKKTMIKAYAELIMSMDFKTIDGSVAFNIVKRSKAEDGSGDARLALSRLGKRFEPKTTMAKSDQLKKFYSMTCGINQDPETYVYMFGRISCSNSRHV